jgi:hypothetical protein
MLTSSPSAQDRRRRGGAHHRARGIWGSKIGILPIRAAAPSTTRQPSSPDGGRWPQSSEAPALVQVDAGEREGWHNGIEDGDAAGATWRGKRHMGEDSTAPARVYVAVSGLIFYGVSLGLISTNNTA